MGIHLMHVAENYHHGTWKVQEKSRLLLPLVPELITRARSMRWTNSSSLKLSAGRIYNACAGRTGLYAVVAVLSGSLR
jgi:hypothetical protein